VRALAPPGIATTLDRKSNDAHAYLHMMQGVGESMGHNKNLPVIDRTIVLCFLRGQGIKSLDTQLMAKCTGVEDPCKLPARDLLDLGKLLVDCSTAVKGCRSSFAKRSLARQCYNRDQYLLVVSGTYGSLRRGARGSDFIATETS